MEIQEYCQCENSSGVYTETSDFGYWDVCCDCNKVVDGSYELYTEDIDVD